MTKKEEIAKFALSCGWEQDGENRFFTEDWILKQTFIVNLNLMCFITVTDENENVRDIKTLGDFKTLLKVFRKQKNYKNSNN